MKKKFFVPLMGAVVLGLSAYAGYRTYDAYAEKQSKSKLLLENIEALANDDESAGSKYEYPDATPFPLTCNVQIGPRPWNKCKVKVITCQGGGSGCNPKDCPSHPSL